MSEESTIQVNFGRAMPLFPLESVSLFPQQILPLHVFEPRYKQLVEHALDGAGQVAMAVFSGSRWKQEYHGRPPIRPVVCVGQIERHQKLPDGRYNLLLRGVCRARIVEEKPADGVRLYREAMLEPVGLPYGEDEKLYGLRERLSELLTQGPLTQLTLGGWIMERVQNEEIPATALLDLVSFALMSDNEVKYRLLAEEDAPARADLVEAELRSLARLVQRAAAQRPERWPKGCSWN